MNRWYNLSWNKIIEILKSDYKRGLSFKQREVNIKNSGKNTLNLGSVEENSFKKVFKGKMGVVLSMIIFLLIILKSYILAILLLIMTLVTSYMEFKNKKRRLEEIDSINNLNYTDVWVMRGGIRDRIKAEELVIGDIVLLNKNEIVPADIRIIEADDLKINERNVIGEEFVSIKNPARIDGEISSLKEAYNIAFRGTRIVDGKGKGIVVEIGIRTRLGSVVRYFNIFNKKSIERKNYINLFKKNMYLYSSLLVSMIAITVVLLEVKNYEILIAYLLFIIGTISTIEISNLLSLKFILKELSEEGIENLNGDTLDRVSNIEVMFIDKLGSITENKMKVKEIYSNNIIEKAESININKNNIERLLNIAVLCNDAKYSSSDGDFKGSLRESALLKFSSDNKIFKASIEAKNKRVFQIINDSHKDIKTTVNAVNRNYRANIRGNVDEILNRSISIMIDGVEKPLEKDIIENIRKIDFNFANTGCITEAIAYRSFNYEPTEDENIENNLVFVGIVAYENPRKENVEKEIRSLKRRGIVPILITDDNKITAYRLAKEVGIATNMSEVISGVEMLSLNKEETIELLGKTKVFCRINPEIRNKIIEIFSENKYKVCTTGENLSQISTILLSEFSIAKGESSAALVKNLSSVKIDDDIISKIILLNDKARVYKYSLKRALEISGRIIIAEIILASILFMLFGSKIFIWLFMLNIAIIPITISIIIVYIREIEKNIKGFIEFILKKWKRLKLR